MPPSNTGSGVDYAGRSTRVPHQPTTGDRRARRCLTEPVRRMLTLSGPPRSPCSAASVSGAEQQTKSKTTVKTWDEDGLQAYVNRFFKRVSETAGATTDLTSHSFGRGDTQHASGDDYLTTQWVFDSGAWDMGK